MTNLISPSIRAVSTKFLQAGLGSLLHALAVVLLTSQSLGLAAQSLPRENASTLLSSQPLWFESTTDKKAMVSHFAHRNFEISKGGGVRISAPVEGQTSEVVLSLEGADASAAVSGAQRIAGESNYLIGQDEAKWRHRVAHFAQAKLGGVYPGIDLTYYGNGASLEYDYAVGAQADPSAIRLQVSGNTRLDQRTGDLLVLQTSSGSELLRLHRPVAYQVGQAGAREPVTASYAKNEDSSFSFTLGSYDHTRPLIIDPTITYSTYFGGSGYDVINDIKTDASGDIYLLVETNSLDLHDKSPIPGACSSGCGPGNPPKRIL